MQSFGISRLVARIIEARPNGVSRADCMVAQRAGGRDPVQTIPCSPALSSGRRDGSYRRQELS